MEMEQVKFTHNQECRSHRYVNLCRRCCDYNDSLMPGPIVGATVTHSTTLRVT